MTRYISSNNDLRTEFMRSKNDNIQCLYIFPECIARVPLWGSGGWGCVRSTLRLRSQPSATVRNRSRDCYIAVPKGSFLDVSNVSLLRFAWQAWHLDVFCNVSKVVLCGRCNTFATFSEDALQFRGRRSTLDVSIVIFLGRRAILDVLCCVFCANRIGRAASSGDKVQIPW